MGVAIAGHLLVSTEVSGTLSGTREVEFATAEADGKRLADDVAKDLGKVFHRPGLDPSGCGEEIFSLGTDLLSTVARKVF